jgi:drug/metabolite transporter (DMT)-like permease
VSTVFLALAVLSFTAFYLLLSFSQKRGNDALGVSFATCCAATAFSVGAAVPLVPAQFPLQLLWIGPLIGLTAGFGLLGIIMALRAGTAITVVNTVVSLSLAVPIVLSLFFYGEAPTGRKLAGMVFAVASIVLLQRKMK